MQDSNAVNPVAILREIEEFCRGSQAGLPRKVEVSNEWSGVAFKLGRNTLLAPMDDVIEILDFPALSIVPLTKPWVRGVANVRGSLLPIIDLNAYLGRDLHRVTGKTRVLVVDIDGIYTGVVVDEVIGLKHFMEDELTSEDPGVDEKLKPYLDNGFRRGDQVWCVFSLLSLVESPLFLQVAV